MHLVLLHGKSLGNRIIDHLKPVPLTSHLVENCRTFGADRLVKTCIDLSNFIGISCLVKLAGKRIIVWPVSNKDT